jgi:quercetin dioxygenase-like cupin family protein
VPQAAKAVIYSRKLLSVIGLEDSAATPMNQGAPIRGAAGMIMTLALCPTGTGPSLHAHRQTFETFTLLQGRFEFSWNDGGDCRAELDRFDTISILPGVCRAFRNISAEEGIVQVLITGGVHDMQDIDFPPATASALAAFGPEVVAAFEACGMRFSAGKSSSNQAL